MFFQRMDVYLGLTYTKHDKDNILDAKLRKTSKITFRTLILTINKMLI